MLNYPLSANRQRLTHINETPTAFALLNNKTLKIRLSFINNYNLITIGVPLIANQYNL
jgi:hypothetical protein